jgi:GTP-binding protein EngB required for normal cell division/gas vesicle protein
VSDSATTTSATQFLPKNPYWLGEVNDQNSGEEYSRVTTCLALSRAVCATNAEYCIRTLNDLKHMKHGITELVYSKNCSHQYLVAFKKCAKEIYVAFRGTDGWETIYSDICCFLAPNEFQGRFHNGFYQRSELIPLAPFIDLLNKNEDFKLIFTGHSLGGAIAATLTARLLFDEKSTNLKLRIHCVAFGSPLICDDDCSKYIDEHYRTHFHFYINRNDVVPIILSTSSAFLSDNLSNIMPLIKTLFDKLKDEVQEKEKRLGSLASEDTSSFIENALCSSESSRGFIDGCLDVISLNYAPFGHIFHVVNNLSSEDSSSECIVPLMKVDFEKLCDKLYDSKTRKIDWSSLLTRSQNHSIKNYLTEIYDRVIDCNRRTSNHDYFTEAKLISKFTDNSPLHHFFLAGKDLWTAYTKETPKSEYIWSVRRDERANEETITLQLQGPAVSFITQVICEQTAYAQNSVKPDKILSHTSLRVFVMTLPLRRNPTVDQYPFSIITHFEVVKLKGLFNPKFFMSDIGLEGRKRQIAGLLIMDLYKLAFSYSTFTGPIVAEHANEPVDVKRRRDVKQYLLLCEKLFQEEFKWIEDLLNKNNSRVEKIVKDEISYFHQERIQRYSLIPISNDVTTTHTEQSSSISTPFKLVKLEDIMDEWQTKISNNDDPGLATTEVIKRVIPTLVAIMFLMVTPKYDSVVEKGIFAGIIGGGFVTLFPDITSIYAIFTSLILGALVGAVGAYIYESTQSTQREYVNILKLLAQSLGLVMKQIIEHPYRLEKEISSIYNDTFKGYNNNIDYIFDHWKNFFPCEPFKSLRGNKSRTYCITLIKCIDAHFQMRQLLSEDFAVGVVGSGRTGKSKLIQELFNFNTKSGKERTVDIHSYRVSDEFRIVDFPHSTSTKDPLRSCYLCNHTLVNAVIVVLDARKLGDESGEKDVIKMVKLLANEGVNVLYCFNITDELIKDRKEDNIESSRVNRFKMAHKTLNHADRNEQPLTQEYRTSWTKEKLKESLDTFAKNYEVNVSDCALTFFELNVPADQWDLTVKKLDELGIKNPNYIKEVWLKKVLESNSVPPKSIEKVMNFWCE